MSLLQRELNTGGLIRFVGPHLPTDDDRLEAASIWGVEQCTGGHATLYLHATPREWLRIPLVGGVLRRFEAYDPMRDRLEAGRKQRDALVDEHYKHYKVEIDGWTERNRTPEEKAQQAESAKAGAEMAALQAERSPELFNPPPSLPAEQTTTSPPELFGGGGDPFQRQGLDLQQPPQDAGGGEYDPFTSEQREPMQSEERQRVQTWRKLQQIKLQQGAGGHGKTK